MVLAAICMPVLLGFLGFAIDFGMLMVEKRKVQAAADAAAVAGATEIKFGDFVVAAQSVAALNGFADGVGGATVSVNPSGASTPTPLNGAYAGQSGYLEVVVSQSTPTAFMSLFRLNAVNVSARAVASLASSPNCVYALATVGSTILLNNNAQLTASNCGVVSDSSDALSISVSESANIVASSIETVGSVFTDNSGSKLTPAALTGIVPVSDPLSWLTPPSYTASSCTADPLTHHGNGGSTYSVGPGSANSTTQNGNTVCYTSLTLGVNADTVTVNPGIYVITGPLTFASGTTLGGSGVTFYLTGTGQVNIGNGATFNFSAPTSGTYNGILFYQNRSDVLPATIEGGANSTINGILYLPGALLTIGNGSTSAVNAQIVAASVAMVGGSKLTVNDYSSINLSSPLTMAKLVE